MAIKQLSYTKMTDFNGCPKRFWHTYINNETNTPGYKALLGTYIHNVLEDIYGVEPKHRTEQNFKEVTAQWWPELENDPDFTSLKLNEEQLLKAKWDLWDGVKGIFKLENPQKIMVEHLEIILTTELNGVPFRGVIDRVQKQESGFTIVEDYKSGRPPAPMFAGQKNFQLQLYASAYSKVTGEKPAAAKLLYLGNTTVNVPLSKGNIEHVEAVLKDTWERIGEAEQNNQYEPKPGPLCGWCPYAHKCVKGIEELKTRLNNKKLKKSAPNYHLAIPAES